MAELAEMVRMFAETMARQQNDMAKMFETLLQTVQTAAPPKFEVFQPEKELFKDYLKRFETHMLVNSISKDKAAQVFLNNQTADIYKTLETVASQMFPPRDVNSLSFEQIVNYMESTFNPTTFLVRERYMFWTNCKRKPGETIHELATRIRQAAATCDFSNIQNPLDESLRTSFVCNVQNEAVLKALFRIPENELSFEKAVGIAAEIESAAAVAKTTVYGETTNSTLQTDTVQVVHSKKFKKFKHSNSNLTCHRCGTKGHGAKDCFCKNMKCSECGKLGHLKKACFAAKFKRDVAYIRTIQGPESLKQEISFGSSTETFEVDSGAGDNFCDVKVWKRLGCPTLTPTSKLYNSATGNKIDIRGVFSTQVTISNDSTRRPITFNVTNIDGLNIIGRTSIKQLQIDVNKLLRNVNAITTKSTSVGKEKIEQLCTEFQDIFEPGLGCLKNFELDIKFKGEATPIFKKPRTIPFAILDNVNEALEAGVRRGIWETADFNDWGTPIVPVRKRMMNSKTSLRICGDYSVTVNHQLEFHRYPMPLPDDLLRKFAGSQYFSKIDLADAYNQVKISKESQKRLALSTHRGVFLQKRLPFGIVSAPAYFQEIMDKVTHDLPNVVVYLDDILVGGISAEEHIQNLRLLFQRLRDKGLRCNKNKCSFANESVEYLGHTISNSGISPGTKIDAVAAMPKPENVSLLKSFLGSVQFYQKFLPDLATIAEPLYRLTRRNERWNWTTEQEEAFQQLKKLLISDVKISHFDKKLPIGIACDASEVGIGAVLFHRFPDGTERPIFNVSKTLSEAQKRYSQIHKEGLAIIFALHKFHPYIFGRKFILVTDHKPLLTLFDPRKATPKLALNRLTRWALILQQYDYTIEYRKTAEHGNADVLSRIPLGADVTFDTAQEELEFSKVCTIKVITQRMLHSSSKSVETESMKDSVISAVCNYLQKGWPKEISNREIRQYQKLKDTLSCEGGCLMMGDRLVVPEAQKKRTLNLLHSGHFGMQRMKQLARSAVYWFNIDKDIEKLCRGCQSCQEHQNSPSKEPNISWTFPDKPWSRIHLDHAINFLGTNWLVVVDAFSKYPCIHPTKNITASATIALLEKEFAHFGYPLSIVTDNARAFTGDEFKAFMQERGIQHVTSAPYHPATNGQAERFIQTFKRSLAKTSLPVEAALQEFLMQYRRTPLASGLSPSQLLHGRQIRTKIDTLRPTYKEETRKHNSDKFSMGTPCYIKYYGPRRDRQPRWVPATIFKRLGARHMLVKSVPHGLVWKRHVEQIRPRYGTEQDGDPGDFWNRTSDKISLPVTRKPRKRVRIAEPENSNTTVEERTFPRRSERLRLKSTQRL